MLITMLIMLITLAQTTRVINIIIFINNLLTILTKLLTITIYKC
jgi:hypothetical protein|nr:MAG TPA: hypothetical protein [Caudoviricetes sp.]